MQAMIHSMYMVIHKNNERIAVTTDSSIKNHLQHLADERNTSLSKVAADMITLALSIHEDITLDERAQKRLNDNPLPAINHDEFWQ